MPKVTHHYEYTLDDDRTRTRAEIQLHTTNGKWGATAHVDELTVGLQDNFDAARAGLAKVLRQLADEIEKPPEIIEGVSEDERQP